MTSLRTMPLTLLRCWLLAVAIAACGGAHGDAHDDDLAVTTAGATTLARAVAQDTTLAAAEREIAAGHPWRATRLLAPVLNDPARRTPAALVVAARAAAGWEGWGEVTRLLTGAPWLDTEFGGEGRELLARAALGSGNDTTAVRESEAAVRAAQGARTRAVRLVLLARALDRANLRDSASGAYAAGAGQLAGARDWLLLRAAGVTGGDSAARARFYTDVSSPTARERVPWTEAQALERSGAAAAAATRYAALGAMPSAFRLRFAVPSDSAARQRLIDSAVAYVAAHRGTANARQTVEVLDRYAGALAPGAELTIARALGDGGPAARAIAGYQRAGEARLTDDDRLDLARLLSRGRPRDAIAELARIAAPALAGQVAYERARALYNAGDGAGARQALRAVADRHAGDAAAAAPALYLLADLRTDDGADDDARALLRRLYTRYPRDSRADDARFRAAIIGLAHGDHRGAAAALDTLVAQYPNSAEGLAARYWAGRGWSAGGDAALAATRWRDLMAREPLSYYSGLAARRLDAPDWRPAAGADSAPRLADVDSVMRRVALLDSLGMDVEARFELDALEARAGDDPVRLVATAGALAAHGEPSRGIRLALRAIDRGARNASAYRLAYPLVDRDALERGAAARAIDPALVAGVIRQESSWNPRAVSPAGARGLMQVMPSVGADIARALRYPVWDARLLFEPDVSLDLGMSHLASGLKQYPQPVRALAAYNAGGSRVTRWATRAGTDDAELFAERIPFVETRDYVRIVQRNAQLYRTLYDLR